MTDSIYTILNNVENMQFEIELNGEKAYLSYRFYKDSIAVMHTFVPKELEGKGIAGTLAKFAFNYAKEQKKTVMVYCPFVAEFIKKHTEYQTQLNPNYHKI